MNFLYLVKRFFFKPKKKNVLTNPPSLRKDVLNLKVQNNVYIQVYWKVLKHGKGPTTSLIIFEKEILKFDCFGKEKGHYHTEFYKNKDSGDKRIYFTEDSALEQVDRTVFELGSNLNYYLQRSKDRRIRKINIEQDSLEDALVKAKAKMSEFIETIPELQGI